MVENLRKSLDKKRKLIHRHFILSPSVVNVARNDDLLDDEDVKALADLEENQMRINLFMEMIEGRGFEFYRKFLIVLRKTGHTSLADKLEPIVAEKRVTFETIPPVKQVTPSPDSNVKSGNPADRPANNRPADSDSESSSSSSSSSSDSDSSDSSSSSRRKKKHKKKDDIPKPTMSGTPRDHAEATAAIDGLYLHYDQAKVQYRRQLDQLRHQEHQLRSSLIVNQHEQRKLRRNLGLVTSVKRQIAFVNDKETKMRNADIDEDKINDLMSFRSGKFPKAPPVVDLSLRKSWKY